MNEQARIRKNSVIKEHGRETRARHASMRPVVVEMKLDLKCLNKTEQEKLWHLLHTVPLAVQLPHLT